MGTVITARDKMFSSSRCDFMQMVSSVPDVKSEPNRFIIFLTCPPNWLHSKSWIDQAWVNWPQFLVPQALGQGARLPRWCLIQGSRWRCNSLAVRSLTHTLSRHGCGRGQPLGMAPRTRQSQCSPRDSDHSEPSVGALNWIIPDHWKINKFIKRFEHKMKLNDKKNNVYWFA